MPVDLKITATTGSWTKIENPKTLPSEPVKPLTREVAQYLAAGTASIALVAALLY
jgi:hypothetical protein